MNLKERRSLRKNKHILKWFNESSFSFTKSSHTLLMTNFSMRIMEREGGEQNA